MGACNISFSISMDDVIHAKCIHAFSMDDVIHVNAYMHLYEQFSGGPHVKADDSRRKMHGGFPGKCLCSLTSASTIH